MSDDLEQRLQQAFQTGSLPPAPASLVEALDRVTDVPVRSPRSMSGRSTFGLLAAALLVATVGALAIGGGSPRPGPTVPTIAPTSSPAKATATAIATAAATGLRLEYQWFDGFHPELATAISIIQHRIASTGVVGATVEAEGTDRIVVTLPGIADADAEPIRRLIGQTGRVDFVPFGQTQVREGQTIDRERHPPMFSGDEVRSATVDTDLNGQPTIDVILEPDGARILGEYTAENIGSYFAITVDDVVIAAPVIQNAIPNGEVQITGAGIDGFDADGFATFVSYLDSGALPFPIYEVGPHAASPSPRTR